MVNSMKGKYNFFDQKAKADKDYKYVLPDDINEPVKKFLELTDCKCGIVEIERFQKYLKCGKIVLTSESNPGASIEVQIDFGMVYEYRKFEVKKKDKCTMYIYSTHRNPYLDKTKPKGGQNGHDAK